MQRPIMSQQITVQTSLDSSFLSTEIGDIIKCDIINGLWDLNITHADITTGGLRNFDSYFAYYTRQCDTAFYDNGRHISARTHRDIINIAEEIKLGKSRDEVHSWLSSKLIGPVARDIDKMEIIDGSIDLTVRLILLIDIGDLKFGFGSTQLVWTANSLEDWTHAYFGEPQTLDHGNAKLEIIFNARNLQRIGGFEIQWTDNLADHLRIMSEDDRKVAIFHHVSFPEYQKENPLFPGGFISETIQTLGLFLPSANTETRKWYQNLKQSSAQKLDYRAVGCPSLRAIDRHIENFHFWHDRIIILKQLFDEAKPKTLAQWWFDRRNVVQWYTFWVAIVVLVLTLIFGLVQCIEGGIQAYVALHSSRT